MLGRFISNLNVVVCVCLQQCFFFLMDLEKKKKKAKHISDADKAMFLEVMKRYVNIIESKKHDNMIIKKKRKAWDDILVDFNAESTVTKTLGQLKVLWKDCKAKAKKAMSKEKRERMKTGGGSNDHEIDLISKTIVDMIPQFFESVSDVQDDDKEHENMISNEEDNSEKEDEPAQQRESNDNSIVVNEEVPTSKEISSMTTSKCK